MPVDAAGKRTESLDQKINEMQRLLSVLPSFLQRIYLYFPGIQVVWLNRWYSLCCAGGIGTVFLEQTTVRNIQATPYSALADTSALLTGLNNEINTLEYQALGLLGSSASQAVSASSVPAFKTNLFANLTLLLNNVTLL